VDDDIDTLQLVGTMLERQGFEIIAANNGEQALEKAFSNTPDLIILDVMMPGMDGYEVTRQLRENEGTSVIPIILFTAKSQVDDKIVGFESGADDYLTKPTHPAELIARVKTILARPKSSSPQDAKDEVVEEKVELPNGKIYGVIAPKGGLGVTSVALNFAVSLHSRTKESVTLAELRPGHGSVSLMLGYPKSDSLNKLLKMEAGDINITDIEKSIVTHSTGIRLLLASFTPSDEELLANSDHVSNILKRLGQIAAYTIVDYGAGLPSAIAPSIATCNKIILAVEPVPATLLHAKELISNLESAGIQKFNIKPVLVSRIRLELTLSNDEVQEELGIPLAGVITPAPELAYLSSMRHQPMIMQEPESITFSQIKRLTNTILGDPDTQTG
ncbi:MAG: response regulator, partial [Chloroflexota bacterium]